MSIQLKRLAFALTLSVSTAAMAKVGSSSESVLEEVATALSESVKKQAFPRFAILKTLDRIVYSNSESIFVYGFAEHPPLVITVDTSERPMKWQVIPKFQNTGNRSYTLQGLLLPGQLLFSKAHNAFFPLDYYEAPQISLSENIGKSVTASGAFVYGKLYLNSVSLTHPLNPRQCQSLLRPMTEPEVKPHAIDVPTRELVPAE